MARYALHRTLPFALFMAFIGLDELLRQFGDQGLIQLKSSTFLYLYPVRAIAVALLLLAFRKRYTEVRPHDLLVPRHTLQSVAAGIVVFILWVNMPWTLGFSGTPQGYDPTIIPDRLTQLTLICLRLFSAVVVVPIVEEIFWRSFVVRYIIDQDFTKVPIGSFTWVSFLISSALFGSEHHLFFAGVMAGATYNLLLHRTRSIAQCVLAHAITNFLLGCYVLMTRQWNFW